MTTAWVEADHPRVPAGRAAGGQFTRGKSRGGSPVRSLPPAFAGASERQQSVVRSVLERMTAGGREVLTRNVADARFFNSPDDMRRAIRAEHGGESISDTVAGAWLLYSEKRGRGRLYLDHERDIGTRNVAGVYAHEFGHAVDWDPRSNEPLSRSAEWHSAWLEEIYWPDEGISNYSKMSKREGFAEFARLLWASDVSADEIAERFPRCLAIFRDAGLVY